MVGGAFDSACDLTGPCPCAAFLCCPARACTAAFAACALTTGLLSEPTREYECAALDTGSTSPSEASGGKDVLSGGSDSGQGDCLSPPWRITIMNTPTAAHMTNPMAQTTDGHSLQPSFFVRGPFSDVVNQGREVGNQRPNIIKLMLDDTAVQVSRPSHALLRTAVAPLFTPRASKGSDKRVCFIVIILLWLNDLSRGEHGHDLRVRLDCRHSSLFRHVTTSF